MRKEWTAWDGVRVWRLWSSNNLEIAPFVPIVMWRPKRMALHFWQRWTRGWDDSDLWSLDASLAKIILPRLKEFRAKGKAGVPSDFLVDGDDRDLTLGTKKYEEALDAMVEAFECLVDEERGLPEMELGPEENGFLGGNISNWDAYALAAKRRQKTIDKGLRLFGRHFQSLWS